MVTCMRINETYKTTMKNNDFKSKVQTVLKSTKLLHEHTIYLLIYAHECILCASWYKKARYCERNFDVCLVVIGIRDIWKIEPNLHFGCHKIYIQYPFCG